MEENLVIHRFEKNNEEEVRFSIREYKGRSYLDIRIWFLPASGGEHHPTKKGITLSLDYLSEIKKGLERVAKFHSENALQTTSNSVK